MRIFSDADPGKFTESNVSKMWDDNAKAWTQLSREGFDIYRDEINTPAFLEMLPSIQGLQGLDIGCGEGHNTRQLAKRGAEVTGLDISKVFIQNAKEHEEKEPLGIEYLLGSAAEMPFEENSYDFVTAFMSMMDMPDYEKVMLEVHRVLKPGGIFQYSISHPCFQTPKWKHLRTDGKTEGIICGDYFARTKEVVQWIFSTVPEERKKDYCEFQIPIFRRTLSDWINSTIGAGFSLLQIHEPHASPEALKNFPQLEDTLEVGYF